MQSIDPEWIQKYVDTLLAFAVRFPEGSKMRDAALLRADHAMDLLKAWKERQGSAARSCAAR
jgi:hypothetical protein